MTDQDKLNLKEKYQNLKEYYQQNPLAYIEDICPDIKLHEYQKTFLNAMMSKQNDFYYVNPYTAHKRWLSNFRLELMKLMGMDFTVLSLSGRDDYENGVLVKKVKEGKN